MKQAVFKKGRTNRNLCGVKNLPRGVAPISARNFGGGQGAATRWSVGRVALCAISDNSHRSKQHRYPDHLVGGARRIAAGIVMPSDLAASYFTTTVVPTGTRL